MQAARWIRTQLIHGRTLCFALGQSPPVDRSAPRATAVPPSGRTALCPKSIDQASQRRDNRCLQHREESWFTNAQTNPAPGQEFARGRGFHDPVGGCSLVVDDCRSMSACILLPEPRYERHSLKTDLTDWRGTPRSARIANRRLSSAARKGPNMAFRDVASARSIVRRSISTSIQAASTSGLAYRRTRGVKPS